MHSDSDEAPSNIVWNLTRPAPPVAPDGFMIINTFDSVKLAVPRREYTLKLKTALGSREDDLSNDRIKFRYFKALL
jgi:hypothetical protein